MTLNHLFKLFETFIKRNRFSTDQCKVSKSIGYMTYISQFDQKNMNRLNRFAQL